MSQPAVPGLPAQRFVLRSAWHAALQAALAGAQREILLADATFADWPLNQPETEASLRAFFHASRVNRLRLLTTENHRLTREAPRLTRVAREFSHAFAGRLANPAAAPVFSRGFCVLIVDRARLVRRFHPDQMRGVAEFDPDAAESWVERFEALWNDATPGLAATTIGLSA